MRFKPVDFSLGNRTILEANRRSPLQLAPISLAIETNKTLKDVDATTRSDVLDFTNVSDDFKSHAVERLAQLLVKKQSEVAPKVLISSTIQIGCEYLARGALSPSFRNVLVPPTFWSCR